MPPSPAAPESSRRAARWSPVERSRRAAARFALYTSLVGVAIIGVLGGRWIESPTIRAREQAWSRVDYAALPEVRLLSEYVRIDTSPTTGNEVAGAEFLAAQLRAAGIAPTVDRVDDRHANVWAVVEGEVPEALVLHSHIDVTPADAAQWDFPPFDGAVKTPWLQGRGSFDMKSVAIAQLLAFLDVHAGRRPHHSVIFLGSSGEEQGSGTGMRRILAQRPELVGRFGAFLTEGGAVEARSTDDIKYWGVEFAQRRQVVYAARAATREALETVWYRLRLRAHWETTPRIGPEAKSFLASYAGSRDRSEFRRLLGALDAIAADPARFAQLPPFVHDLLVDTLGATAPRPIPGGFELPLTLLLLPDSDLATVRAELLPAELLEGSRLELLEDAPAARGSSLAHPVYDLLRQSLTPHAHGAPVGPYMLANTLTDARFVRARGIPAYGYSPFLFLSIDTYRVDKADERIGLPGYVAGVKLYRETVRRLAADPSPWR